MTKKIKIGLFIDTFFPMIDGVVMVVDNYARRLADIADVTVFAPHGREPFDDSSLPYKVVRCKMIKLIGIDYDLPVPAFDPEFRRELNASKLDIVHIHSPFSIGREGLAYAKRKKIPIIGTMHSQYKQDFFTATKSKLLTNSLLKNVMNVFNSCTECWTVNKESVNIFVDYGAKNKPKVQPNGTDITGVATPESVQAVKEKHGILPHENVFLFVGRINKLKNIFFIVDALKVLSEQGFAYKMLFVGSGQDEDELRDYVASLGLQNSVVLVGKISNREEVTSYYRAADLFLFPSLYDTNGLVQIEAASQKTPTIFIAGSAASSTAIDNVSGYMAEHDAEKFASKIQEIFANSAQYESVCQGAYDHIYVSWDKAVQNAYQDYLQAIEQFKYTKSKQSKHMLTAGASLYKTNEEESMQTNQKLKIGLFIDTFFPMVDGVVMVVDNYARRLKDIADVTVFAPYGRDEFDDSTLPYKVVRCKMIKLMGMDYDFPIPAFDSDFRRELNASKLDIVHIHSPFSIGREGLNYAKRKKIPVVATMHSQFKQDFYTATKSKMLTNSLLSNVMSVFNACTECWAVNSEVSNIFVDYGAKTKPKVQNNGTDIALIEDETRIQAIKDKHDILPHEKVFLFVGRINKLKNIMFTVDALKHLSDHGFAYKMLFVGTGQDEDELREHIASYGLQDKIILVGKITDRNEMTAYYHTADMFLFPSLYDASSLVQIEAASQKTPTLFLRGSATSATATEDVNGFMSEHDPIAYAKKIEEIFANPDYYQSVSEGAYRDLFVSWDKAVSKAYADYTQIIQDFKIKKLQKIKKIAQKRVKRKKQVQENKEKALEKRIQRKIK